MITATDNVCKPNNFNENFEVRRHEHAEKE